MLAGAPLLVVAATAQAQAPLAPPVAPEHVEIYRAAGITIRQGHAVGCAGAEPDWPASEFIIEERDLNGDGHAETIVSESNPACHGDSTAWTLLARDELGQWRKLADGMGMVGVLASKGVGGWLDIEVGGSGFCFPVLRWNGRGYVRHRHEHEGKPCRPR